MTIEWATLTGSRPQSLSDITVSTSVSSVSRISSTTRLITLLTALRACSLIAGFSPASKNVTPLNGLAWQR